MSLRSNVDLPSSKKFIFNVLLELVICFWENDTDIRLLGVIMNAFIVVIAIVSTINIVRKDIFDMLIFFWRNYPRCLSVHFLHTDTGWNSSYFAWGRRSCKQLISSIDYKKVQSCSWCMCFAQIALQSTFERSNRWPPKRGKDKNKIERESFLAGFEGT